MIIITLNSPFVVVSLFCVLPIYEITKILNIYFKSDKIFGIFYLEVSHISRLVLSSCRQESINLIKEGVKSCK